MLNVTDHTLLLGPAERADVIVDFSQVPAGSKLILYNDAPAPVPAFDPRYDYYTGDPDQTATGGAPTTLPGYGPNTRTIMQFQVQAGTAAAPRSTWPRCQAPAAASALRDKRPSRRPDPRAARRPYNAAYRRDHVRGATPTSRIQDTSR